MTTIMSLSNEVINIILEYISIKDIENFSSTCKKFRQTTWSNKMWMKKLYQNWPSTKIFFDNLTSRNLARLDFKEEVKAIASSVNKMWGLISQMPKDNLSDTDKKVSVLQLLKKTMNDMIYHVIVEELNRIILQNPWTSDCDLTRRYYSCHIFRQLKYYHTKHKFLQFYKSKNRNQQVLEEIVSLLVQWFDVDSDISYTQIVKPSLDYIALKVLQDLSVAYPSHPIFTISSVLFNYWNNHNVFLTYWEKDEILAILTILERVIFSSSNFHILNEIWLKSHGNVPEIVISEGTQCIFFLTIYQSVLRKLGVHSIVVTENILQVLLKMAVQDVDERPMYFCVELIDGRLFVDTKIKGGNFDKNKVDSLLFTTQRCNALKIVPLLIDFLKIELYLTEEEQLMLQEIMDRDEDELTDLVMWKSNMNINMNEPERRSAELKFIIGTIVSYTYDGRTHFGVIVGWHNYFNLNSISGIEFDMLPYNYSNISCENVENCTNRRCLMHKPYYIIFSNNNKYCYVKQENVSICSSARRIYHDEIGRYFSRYEYTYYVPNEMLAKDYPYDIAIINYFMHHELVMLP
ncbi:uncharacterized protein LOC115240309 [Formica exsecta]|uniref:uncharacterized protein LOC115240309 n=1 Tax=Formica exsecta TaxID=72781 RepID=UPI0011428A6C|nr:uncharacterized protein LOC115240309 [Formica exsecta]